MARVEGLAIVIPTKDRPADLERALASIAAQDYKPARIVIVDGGASPVEHRIRKIPGLSVEYIRKFPPSLTAQRNAGIRHLGKDVSVVVFFDDDVVLEEGCLCNMMKFWQSATPDTGGAGFNVINVAPNRPTLFQKLFVVNDDAPGRILRSGFQSRIPPMESTVQVQWVVGCAMAWRADIFDEFMFDEWFAGYARYEEVDFSCRVGKKYRIFLVADAKVRHLNAPENLDFSAPLGKMEVLNRIYFVKKNPPLSVPLCYWSLSGLLLNNIVKGLIGSDRRYLYRAKGNLAGLAASLLKL
jgi:GT2 family glycosyltransferase